MQSELSLLEQIKQDKIWEFPGGIHPPEQKSLSNQTAINDLPSCQRYYVPIKQHIGSTDDILVNVGDDVLGNQALTDANLAMTVPVHAPVAGKVVAIEPHVSAHASAKPELTIVIERSDNQKTISAQPIKKWASEDRLTLATQIKKMGLSGMGGAGFPTHIKVNSAKPIDVLILNGVECEPYITSDDVLMREFAHDIITGGQILQHVLQSKICVIAIEDNKPEAIESIKKACEGIEGFKVKVVPTKYPSGGEKQLIQLLTGEQVPSGSIPADLGIVMQNVGTAYAVKEAIIDGLPLTKRVVTITGDRVSASQNVWALLGTPVSELLLHAGFNPEKDQRVIMGGPMMGFAVLDAAMPVIKTTNCILAPSAYKLPEQGVEQACIRCGLCADACPAELLPQQLQWFSKAKDHEKLEDYNLFDCIECGACAYVCPSQIPLVQYYRTSKAEIREAQQEKIKSDKAKVRFEQRQERLEREKEARLAKHKASAEKRAQALQKDTSAKDKIAAALARAKAKKAAKAEESNASVPATVEEDAAAARKAKVAEAIARAKAKKASSQESSQSTDAAPEAETLAKEKPTSENKEQPESQSSEQATPSADELRKQKIAAAIAKAKAKKAKSD